MCEPVVLKSHFMIKRPYITGHSGSLPSPSIEKSNAAHCYQSIKYKVLMPSTAPPSIRWPSKLMPAQV